jgi:hypothetical protein
MEMEDIVMMDVDAPAAAYDSDDGHGGENNEGEDEDAQAQRLLPRDIYAGVRQLWTFCPWLHLRPLTTPEAAARGPWQLTGTWADVRFMVTARYPVHTLETCGGDELRVARSEPNTSAPAEWTLVQPQQTDFIRRCAQGQGTVVPLLSYLTHHCEAFVEDDTLLVDEDLM